MADVRGPPAGHARRCGRFRRPHARGQRVLRRAQADWELIEHGDTRRLSTAEVLRLVGTGDFFPRTVDVVPDLAQMLFMEAVHQAEVSHGRVIEAQTHIDELPDNFRQNPTPWVLATAELDRAVRASIASILLAIAAAEAQVNRWAELSGGWQNGEDGLSAAEKCLVLADRAGRPISLGKPPYQRLRVASLRRNALVHSKPTAERIPVTGANAPMPGRSAVVDARTTCLAVRQSLVDLAGRIGVDPPRYLASCPPSRPDDDEAWRAASLRTGLRRDPVFPPMSQQLADGAGHPNDRTTAPD